MAEIRVEKRKKPVWPWILGLLAIVAVAFLLLNNREVKEVKDDVASKVTDTQGGQAAGMSDAEENTAKNTTEVSGLACIDRFSNLVEEKKAEKAEGVNHEYTHEGLKYLSCSLESLIEKNNLQDANLDEKRKSLTEAADKIQKETASENHASEVKNAFKQSVDIMEALQKKSYPELQEEVAEVKKAAKNFESQTSTLEQKDELGEFFRKANNALVAMRDKK